MRNGDKQARIELFGHLDERIRKLAKKLLRYDTKRMRATVWSASLVNRTFERFMKSANPDASTVDEFLKRCMQWMRWELKDIARQMKRNPGNYGNGAGAGGDGASGNGEQPGDGLDAVWDEGPSPSDTVEQPEEESKMWQAINALPSELRDVVYQYRMMELPQWEVARVLNLPNEKAVSRLWIEAKKRLRPFLDKE